MISKTLETIQKYLEIQFKEMGTDWKVYLNALEKEGQQEEGLYITLLRIEEETSMKKQVSYHPLPDKEGYFANPDLCINLFIVISSQAQNYNTALMQISKTLYVLNNIYDFAPQEEEPLPQEEMLQQANVATIMKSLSIELQTLTAEQNNSLWQTLGCKVMPAVCYKVRMLTLKDSRHMAYKEIREIQHVWKKMSLNQEDADNKKI